MCDLNVQGLSKALKKYKKSFKSEKDKEKAKEKEKDKDKETKKSKEPIPALLRTHEGAAEGLPSRDNHTVYLVVLLTCS